MHRDLTCVALADKRRAFPRALRLDGPLDVSPVRDHVAGQQQSDLRDPDPRPARGGALPARREQAEP